THSGKADYQRCLLMTIIYSSEKPITSIVPSIRLGPSYERVTSWSIPCYYWKKNFPKHSLNISNEAILPEIMYLFQPTRMRTRTLIINACREWSKIVCENRFFGQVPFGFLLG